MTFGTCPRCEQPHGVPAPSGRRLECAGCGERWDVSMNAWMAAGDAADAWDVEHGTSFRQHVEAKVNAERVKAQAAMAGRWR